MSLTGLIASSITSEVGDDQAGWRQFVLDHIVYIRNLSKVTVISAEVMNQYRYNLKHYLKQVVRTHQDIGWIVQLLNELRSDMDFYIPGSFYIPQDNTIRDLYLTYATTRLNAS